MKTAMRVIILVFVLPFCASAQANDSWPPLNYLRSDYKSVRIVAHVRVREAEIVNRIPGLENWRIEAEVVEPFKGKFRKGDALEYFHGAEAGFKKELFLGEKIVFLLAEYDRDKKAVKYSVLENSTLPYNEDRVKKLRIIKRSYTKKRSGH